MSYFEGYLTLSNGMKIFYRKWIPENVKAVVAIAHGYAEHSGRYLHVGEFLSSNGYAVYIQDHIGHGKSDGEKGFIRKFDDFIVEEDEFIDFVRKETNSEKVFLLGHSMGGLIATLYAEEHQDKLKGLILSGAALDAEGKPNPIALGLLKLIAVLNPKYRPNIPINPDYLTSVEEVNRKYMEDLLVFKQGTIRLLNEMLKAQKKARKKLNLISIPVLIMHGEKDKIVPPSASRLIYEKISSKDKKLIIWKNSKHEILNDIEKDQVLKTILKWLNNHL